MARSVKRGRWVLVVVGLLVGGLLLARDFITPSAGPPAADAPVVGADAAAERVGGTARVCGRVVDASYVPEVDGRPTFLNFGARHPDQAFTAVIWGDVRDRFEAPPEDLYGSRRICVTGRVELHEGTPQIEVRTPEQIGIPADSAAADAGARSASGAGLVRPARAAAPTGEGRPGMEAREGMNAQEAAVGPLSRPPEDLLAGLSSPALLPAWLPSGVRATSVRVTRSEATGEGYRVEYRGTEGSCFSVEGAAGGFGGPVPSRDRTVELPGLPAGDSTARTRLYWTEGQGPGTPFPRAVVFSDWIPGPGSLHHRLRSPPDPRAGCSPLPVEVASRIVGTLRPAGAERWDLGSYLSITAMRPFLERRADEGPISMARRALERMGFADPAGEMPEAPLVRKAEVSPAGGDTVRVLITRSGGGDDSVAEVRYLVVLMPERGGDRWLYWMGRQFRCQPGRGPPGWSSELCP